AIRNDSWWAIAEQVLGDGERWKELRSANVGRTMPDGTLIGPRTEDVRFGWPLLVPDAGAPGAASTGVPRPTEVVVQRGDNLWSITEHVLATEDGHQPAEAAVRERWAEVIELNRDRLADPADPDVIYAGQVLRVAPEPAAPAPARPAVGSEPAAAGGDPGAPALPTDDPVAPAPPEPGPPPTTGAVPATVQDAVPATLPGDQAPEAPGSRPTATHGDADGRTEAPIGMLGTAGTMVAVGVAAVVARRRRRRQLQLPPRAMAPPPPDEFRRPAGGAVPAGRHRPRRSAPPGHARCGPSPGERPKLPAGCSRATRWPWRSSNSTTWRPTLSTCTRQHGANGLN
ncbi:MAG: LysM peptidoglycan-binding domain-containing protein, partial [Acidimicrobiales bacterium]